ncbi:MAG: hypothetical protein M3365_01200, partial [Gemmatimonadota bacterium]|nr:hypothetical protein [Gemmatimonadota bacterium]
MVPLAYRFGLAARYSAVAMLIPRLAAITVIFAAVDAGAQASPYVPLDDIAYRYVDAVMARGEFRQLSALERPYTVGALLAAIDTARVKAASARVIDYLNALETVVGKYSVRPRSRVRQKAKPDSLDVSAYWQGQQDSDTSTAFPFRARGTVNLYATMQTSSRRELMLAADAGSISPAATIRLVMAGGPIAASIRPIIDTRLNEDIEFFGRRDRQLAGRTEDGYLSGQWKYAELFLGRVGRNWGPPTLTGLQLGNYAFTYDQLYGRIGTDKLHLATVVARLDDFQDAGGARAQRYFSVHRLAVRHASWEIAATESYLYSGSGRGFEPSLVNPLNIYSLSWRNEAQDGNLGLG